PPIWFCALTLPRKLQLLYSILVSELYEDTPAAHVKGGWPPVRCSAGGGGEARSLGRGPARELDVRAHRARRSRGVVSLDPLENRAVLGQHLDAPLGNADRVVPCKPDDAAQREEDPAGS